VAVFSAFGTEVATDLLVARLRERGSRVLLPVLEGGEIHMAEYGPGEALVETAYGPREPADRSRVRSADIDAVIVPGLAFDSAGNRIGYGRGYYDRFLVSLPPRVIRVGVCFSAQLVDAVPHGEGDEPVDLVVTELGVVDTGRRRGGERRRDGHGR
jgi:5-formyltetrahydrofolate cyclo-ligase